MSAQVEPDIRSFAYGNTLHEAALRGDRDAFNLIAEAVLPAVVMQMKRASRGEWVQEHIHTAVVDAYMNYVGRPDQYKPEMGKSLYSYLLMSAQGDLKNLLSKEVKRDRRLDSLDAVDNWDGDAEYDLSERHFPDGFDLEQFVIEGESPVWRKIPVIFSDPRDCRCAYYVLADVRDTAVYVDIYSLHDLPPKEQDHVVKKHKDRIKKRLKRNLDPEEYRDHD